MSTSLNGFLLPFFTTSQLLSTGNLSVGTGSDNPGLVFTAQGHDFFGPNNILNIVDNFSHTLQSPTTGGSLFPGIPADIFGPNPPPFMIFNTTQTILNQIFSPTFGADVFPGLPNILADPLKL